MARSRGKAPAAQKSVPTREGLGIRAQRGRYALRPDLWLWLCWLCRLGKLDAGDLDRGRGIHSQAGRAAVSTHIVEEQDDAERDCSGDCPLERAPHGLGPRARSMTRSSRERISSARSRLRSLADAGSGYDTEASPWGCDGPAAPSSRPRSGSNSSRVAIPVARRQGRCRESRTRAPARLPPRGPRGQPAHASCLCRAPDQPPRSRGPRSPASRAAGSTADLEGREQTPQIARDPC